jgi:hypothetical protein
MTLKTRAVWHSGLAAALILLCRVSSPAQTQAPRVLKHESERHELFQDDSMVFRPAWQGSAVLGVEGNRSDEPVIYGVDRDGRIERIGFSFPGGRYVFVGGLAGTRDGTVAVICSAYSNEGQPGTFLARISPDRSRKIVVRLWPYSPKAVTVSPDGDMWTVGFTKTPDNQATAEYNVLKRFDPSGKLLTTISVRARGGLVPPDAVETSVLRAGKDRVGWLTNAYEYIEFGLDGREIGRFQPPPGSEPQAFGATLALSEDNAVLVGTGDSEAFRVWSLDREKHSWNAVEMPGAKPTGWATLGFDGDRVVLVHNRSISGATVARYSLSAAQ